MAKLRTFTLGLALAAGLASPAVAGGDTKTRVVDCRAGSCLQVSGHRDSAAAAVSRPWDAVQTSLPQSARGIMTIWIRLERLCRKNPD